MDNGIVLSGDPKTQTITLRVSSSKFWDRTRKKNGCWEWIGHLDKSGYGQLIFNLRCHRIAFAIARGDVFDGDQVLHHCDNRACINPDHLYSGTNNDNIKDKCAKGRNRIGPRRLKRLDVLAIRKIYTEGQVSQKTLATKFQVSIWTIQSILRRKTWKKI